MGALRGAVCLSSVHGGLRNNLRSVGMVASRRNNVLPMPKHVDYYFSFPSPWAYIGHAAFEAIARANGCTVRYRPVMLGELFAETGGLPLAKRHPARQRYRLL